MSKLTFRARTLDVSKPMAIFKAEDLPELAAENAINRAVPALPTGMEKEEETEKHLQDILEAQTKGLVKRVAELVIPTPEVIEDQEGYDNLIQGVFKQPRQYIHVQPVTADQDLPDYDLDDEDVKFFNEELRDKRKFEVSMITLEDMIDRLEKNSGQTVLSLKEAKMLLKEDDDLILCVYDYWLNKRLETQQCLMPLVKCEPNRDQVPGQTANPYIAFRRRTEKMQTRKNRKNEEDSYMRMLKLRRDINRVVSLLDLLRRREKLKKENLHLITEIFEKRVQAEDWDGTIYEQVVAQRQAKQPPVQPYPLSSWINIGNSDQILGIKKEKRIYRKRKHKNSFLRNGFPNLMKVDHGLLPMVHDNLSSDDDKSSSIGAKQSDVEMDDNEENDGPFSFRRKAGVEYLAPCDDLFSDVDNCDDKINSFFPLVIPLDLSRSPEYVGFCRRRVGRGGRVLLDRAPPKWEAEQANLDYIYGDEDRILRPLTPEHQKFIDWDPYRAYNQEVF